jgi:transposase-like protein
METTQPRVMRGYAILAKGEEPKPLAENTFLVHSQSGNGNYNVTLIEDEWHCECPDYQFRNVACKHIHAVRFWLALRKKIEKSSIFNLGEEIQEAKHCRFCGSPMIIKQGMRKCRFGFKQVYLCKDCGKKFVPEDAFQRMRYDPRIITVTLDLYYKGTSLRKISDHLEQFYGIRINYATILRWVRKFGKMIEEYANTLDPNLSGQWHADEMAINVKGKWMWLWNVMDKDTRFMLASLISEKRQIQDARKVFQKAKTIGKSKPEMVVTDGLHAYEDAFKKEFFTLRNPRTKHIRMPRFIDETNNNIIERAQGTIRERDKVMSIQERRIGTENY